MVHGSRFRGVGVVVWVASGTRMKKDRDKTQWTDYPGAGGTPVRPHATLLRSRPSDFDLSGRWSPVGSADPLCETTFCALYTPVLYISLWRSHFDHARSCFHFMIGR